LSICRELAVLMNGEVGVQSRLGDGSCFWAELPLPPALPAPAAAAEPVLDASASLRGASVLMVEDNPVNMLIAVALLEQWGVSVEQATDGQQAVAAVQRRTRRGERFDAVLMDVQMPVMSGHEATRALRREHSAVQLPIIALTAAALVSEREQALAAGMNDFMTKPIDAQRLHCTLARWVAQRGET
jgi:CheY-like chemotaxis protein